MPRVRSQLAIQADPELLGRVRAAAKAQGRTVTALVTDWIDAGLAASGCQTKGAVGTDLADRMNQLEALVAELQRQVAGLAGERRPLPQPVGAPLPKPTAPAPVQAPTGEAISTAQLAENTGTNRASWNNWAAKAKPGAVRNHATAGNWRLVGKEPSPDGGPERWMWQPA